MCDTRAKITIKGGKCQSAVDSLFVRYILTIQMKRTAAQLVVVMLIPAQARLAVLRD